MNGGEIHEFPRIWTAISHEIRTPLNVIMGMTDISENEIYNVKLMKNCLSKIRESSEAMQQVVNSLVDYAAISEGKIELQKAKFDFKTLITEVAMRSYILSKQKECHFNVHVHRVSEEMLIGDEARVNQVLMALLNVVVRYTAAEGAIDFTVHQTGATNSVVFMRFRMRSTALEFPDEIVGYLNENARLAKCDLLEPSGAFGLTEMNALYIAYLMGGKITAYNKPGDYSEIVFDVKFDRAEQPELQNKVRLFVHQRILIVADTQEICKERGGMLVDMGMQYDSAIESEEALEKIGEAEDGARPFTICIIDWDLQSRKCMQLIRDIRDIFGQKLIVLAAAQNPTSHQKIAEVLGVNYVIDRTIFRSTLFDALVSAEKGVQLKQNTAKEESYDFSGSRVLVAEDVALNMEVVTKMLSRVNAEVICVENGLEATTQFNKRPAGYFGAILLDINMPVMDGYEACRAIRKSEKADAGTVPIFAMTANAFQEDVEKALDAGMDGHIAKPIDVHALYRVLSQALNKPESNALNRLRDLAALDPLTGCLNRRGFEQQMRELMESKLPIAYVAIDVDDFKYINDHFGHEIGDEVLKKVVRLLKQKFRATDIFVRFGGDEFAVIMVDYKKRSVFLTQRMQEINEELLHPSDGFPPVTVSAGAVISGSGYHHDLYSSADKALYRSKNRGKGTTTVFEGVAESAAEETTEEEELYTEDLLYVNEQIKVLIDRNRFFQSKLMTQNKPVGYATGFYDQRLPVYSFNGFFPKLLGYTIAEFRAAAVNGFAYFVHPDDIGIFLQFSGENILMNEKVRLCSKNGDYYWFNVDYILTKTTDNRKFWMASLKNIDEYLVGSLCVDDYRMVALIDLAQDSVTIEKGAYLISDKEMRSQKKYSYSSLLTQVAQGSVKESEQENYLDRAALSNVCRKLRMGGVYEFTAYQRWGSDNYSVVRHKYRHLPDKANSILCTWELLGERAEIDDLTDTLNGSGFYREVERILKAEPGKKDYSILYFNVSGFKAWNSILGRNKADILLKLIARRIRKSELAPSCVARMGSDHFAVLTERRLVDLNQITQICNKSFEIDENSIRLQMRCGIFDVEDVNEPVDSMCDKAKLAILQIPNEHAVPYHRFDLSLTEKYLQQKYILNQVGHALERKEIRVYYQPIVDTKTQKIASAEALIRWIQADNQIISPAAFIPALEEQGYIADVDTYAQSTVSDMLHRRYRNQQHIVPVSVNVSRMDFLNNEFVSKMMELIQKHGVVKDYMRVEVTESSFTDVGKSGEELLKSLREQGLKILMDDFGTGFSTLSGITSQQFDIVKIDMSFVRGLGKNNGSEAVIENVISMCHALNLSVVAEGVETEAQYRFLLQADCDYIQGYYFYRPMPGEKFEILLDQNA